MNKLSLLLYMTLFMIRPSINLTLCSKNCSTKKKMKTLKMLESNEIIKMKLSKPKQNLNIKKEEKGILDTIHKHNEGIAEVKSNVEESKKKFKEMINSILKDIFQNIKNKIRDEIKDSSFSKQMQIEYCNQLLAHLQKVILKLRSHLKSKSFLKQLKKNVSNKCSTPECEQKNIPQYTKKAACKFFDLIWNNEIFKTNQLNKLNQFSLPLLGGNFEMKKVMDATFPLNNRQSVNPNWWNRFSNNHDVALDNYLNVSSDYSHSQPNYYISKKPVESPKWYGNRPWNYQMNGWGNKMYSQFSHNLDWIRDPSQRVIPVPIPHAEINNNNYYFFNPSHN